MGKLFELLRDSKLVRSGILYAVASFVVGLGNLAYQRIIGTRLSLADVGDVNFILPFMTFLALPLMAASTAISHYVAHFRASGDEARLQGLLSGCRRALFHLTLFGSIAAVLLLKPLSVLFNFSRPSLLLVTVVCVLASFWSTLASALCSGLGWFRRLSVILLGAMLLRLAFGWFVVSAQRTAEMGILASGVSALAYLALFRWRKDLLSESKPISPWTGEFAGYLIVAGAFVCGQYFFSYGDVIAGRPNFPPSVLGFFTVAHNLGLAVPIVIAPLLSVLFTSRSAHRTASVLHEQLTLLGLSALGLAVGAIGLFVLRDLAVRIIFKVATPACAAMIGRMALTMVFVGLLQSLGTWALASRWFKMSIAYGVLGLAYWLTLLLWGNSSDRMLGIMPVAAAAAFALLLVSWLVTLRSHRAAMRKEGSRSETTTA